MTDNHRWEGEDEPVEVNQRALIDKVLARYSAKFTVFRELLQNADDAEATAVQIIFETKKTTAPSDEALEEGASGDRPPPNLDEIVIETWVVKNNGMLFRDEDWSRLKKIADGNPDDKKIGAFGVGFYSLFSVTEEPLVTSGTKRMGFYWRNGKNQLYVRRGELPPTEGPISPWTTFTMPLRQIGSLPGTPLDLLRFFASSIVFMSNISTVELFLDGTRLGKISKEAIGLPQSISVPPSMATGQDPSSDEAPGTTKSGFSRMLGGAGGGSGGGGEREVKWGWATPKKYFTLTNVTSTPVHVHADVIEWVEKVEEENVRKLPTYQGKEVEASVLLNVFTAEADVKLDEEMNVELERATKKRAPPCIKVSLIYTGKEAYDASERRAIQGSEQVRDPGSVFLGLRADIEGNNTSKIYIGHATAQTTGISGHISARFIPTVERESIDLADRHVSVWNIELLHVCGYLSRVAYENELSDIARLYSDALLPNGAFSGEDEERASQLHYQLQHRCLHALRFFTFRPSTPSSDVSEIMQSAFFDASSVFNILSTVGVRSSKEVRVWNSETDRFIRLVSVLPRRINLGASRMINVLLARNMIAQMSFDDVVWELQHRCFGEDEMIECLKWLAKLPEDLPSYSRFKQLFLDAAAFMVRDKETATRPAATRLVKLSSIQTYFEPSGFVPSGGPFPASTLPSLFTISKGFPTKSLTELFGWAPFSINDWVLFLTSKAPRGSRLPEHDLTCSLPFAERALTAVARGWTGLSKANQEDVVKRLSPLRCVPTQLDLQYPKDAYLPAVHLFPDLPIATFASTGALQNRTKTSMEALLRAMGVRRHVDLQIVFSRMVETGDWTVVQLVRYLMGVKDQMVPSELETLKQMAAFAMEERQEANADDHSGKPDAEAGTSTSTEVTKTPPSPKKKKRVRYKIGALYEPTEPMRQLRLPLLDWGDQPKWRSHTDEAKFLFSLGLQRYPPLGEILRIAAGDDPAIRKLALDYFLNKYSIHREYSEYKPDKFKDIAFIPAIKPDGKEFLAKHSEVFLEPGCEILGFAVIRSDLKDAAYTKLKLSRHPPKGAASTALIQNPPKTEEQAKKVFEYLANLLGDFDPVSLQQLKDSKIIPAERTGSTGVTLMKPSECFFKSNVSANFRSKLFTFVDFGARANTFLTACGVRTSPTAEDVALMLIADPKRFYELAGDAEKFKTELKYIAANFDYLTQSTKQAMRRAPILLGCKFIEEKDEKAGADAGKEDNSQPFSYELLRADQIVVIDDMVFYMDFCDILYGAPQDDALETMYLSLGSQRLAQLVKEDYRPIGEMRDASEAAKLRKLVLERLPLFLHRMAPSQIRIKVDWLQTPRNFLVKKAGRVVMQKTLNFGGKRAVRESEVSAAIRKELLGNTLVLYIAHNVPLDFYE
ncbi:hypothetical protein FRC17_000941 [Serendipita sp. 399]|nr:hypothetical protein FRC17_000941 [Serendipita sp. 399]